MKKLTWLVAILFPLTSLAWSQAEELLKSADEVLAEISRLRELPAKSPIEKGVKNREEIKAYIVERIQKEYPAGDLELERKALVKLGLIPADLKMLDLILDLLTEQVMGFYDPHTRMLYIADWIPVEAQKAVMAHELMHALQDQHFDLLRFMKRTRGNDDALAARNAIVEGEGLAVMLDYIMKPMGQNFLLIPDVVQMQRFQMPVMESQFKVFAGAPAYLKEALLFPYTYGLNFIQAYRRQHPWKDVANVYSDLPKSTEQIIHPEKYMTDRDEPTPLKAAERDHFAKEWKKTYDNVLGEFTIYLLIRQFTEESLAQRASAGWDGDLMELFESPGRIGFVLRSVWDSEQDATEFFEAYRQLVLKKYPDAELIESSETKFVWKAGESTISLQLQGRNVEVVES